MPGRVFCGANSMSRRDHPLSFASIFLPCCALPPAAGAQQRTVIHATSPGAHQVDSAGPARLQVFSTRADPGGRNWSGKVVAERPVIHAIEVIDADGDGLSDVLTASGAGVDLFLGKGNEPLSLTAGAPGQAPKRGS